MNAFVDNLNTKLPHFNHHACVKAAYVAYRLSRIHPFEDGNGRVARLLANYVLMGDGLPFPVLLCASAADRKQYIAAFSSSSPQQLAHVILQRVLSSWRRYSFLLNKSILSTGLPEKTSLLSPDAQLRALREHLRLEQCAICFDDQCEMSLLCCGRPFHAHCLTTWFSSSQKAVPTGSYSVQCPQCRQEIDMRTVGIKLLSAGADEIKEPSTTEETTETTEETTEQSTESTNEDDTTKEDKEVSARDRSRECNLCNNKRAKECTNGCCGRCCGKNIFDFGCAKHRYISRRL